MPFKETENIVELQNYSLKYNHQSSLALKNINLTVKKGKKIGIVGRTGAGKSSIVQSLLRIYESEPTSKYFFEGKDGFKLGLHYLRKKISVIPQIPFFFKGSVRINLDPFNEHSDK